MAGGKYHADVNANRVLLERWNNELIRYNLWYRVRPFILQELLISGIIIIIQEKKETNPSDNDNGDQFWTIHTAIERPHLPRHMVVEEKPELKREKCIV